MVSKSIQSNKLADIRGYPYIATCIVCLAIAIRLLGLNKGIWLDEYASLKIIFSKDMFATFGLYDNQPPLYLMLLKLWSSLGTSEEFLRTGSVCLGTGVVIVVIGWLKPYSKFSSIVAGLLCATLPIQLRYSQELRNYPLFLFSTALSFFFASKVAANTGKLSRYLGLTFSLSVVVASHLVGMAMVTSVIVFLAAILKDYRKIFTRKFILTFMVPSIVFLYILFFWTPWIPNRNNWWVPPFSIDVLTSTANYVFGVPSLLALVESIKPNSLVLANLFEFLITSTIVILVVGLGVGGNWRRSWPWLVAALFYWLQIIAYSIFVTPVFIYRTVLPGLIPFIGFLGLQLATISAKRVRWFGIAVTMSLSFLFVIRWTTTDAYVPVEPYRQAAQFLESNRQPSNLVVFYPSYIDGPIRYYATELQSEDVILIGLGGDMNEGILEIGKRISFLKEKGIPPVVFLVLRADANVNKDLAPYQSLLKYLESNIGSLPISQSFGIISISKYVLDESKPN